MSFENMTDEDLIQEYKHAKYMEQQCNSRQMVSKVLINSLFGAQGNKFFRLFNVNIARAITANTRFYINLLNHRITESLTSKTNKNDKFVLYNDTDSQYITLKSIVDTYCKDMSKMEIVEFLDKWIQEELDPVIQSCNNELADILNALEGDAIQAEREAIADRAVFLAKKKYYMRVYDMEGVRYDENDPYMKRMGIEIIRSSTPQFVKDNLENCINIILDKDESSLREWVKEVKTKFIESPIADISKTTSVGNLNYNITDKGVPINSRAALAMNNYINSSVELSGRYANINAGDKIKIVYMRTPNVLGQNIMGYIDSSLAERFRDYVDYDTCWDKYFMSPLKIMVDPLGWNIENSTASITDDEW